MKFTATAHRPWKLPDREWSIHMIWHDLLFLHWPVPIGVLRPLIPSQLDIDIFDGKAWIGIVPFTMSEVYLRTPFRVSLPSRFCELNVRTYVTTNGKPGVWFFSLDTESLLTVIGARLNYQLPYYLAKMSAVEDQGSIFYSSQRKTLLRPSEFVSRYKSKTPAEFTKKGSLEYWLTERYRLYTQTRFGRIAFSDIHHEPWPLQTADCDIYKNTMHGQLNGVPPLTDKPFALFAKRLEVVAWSLESI